MNATARHEERAQAIGRTVARIRAIEAEQGVSPATLDQIKQVLLELAGRRELFPLADFPMPPAGAERNNALYRLARRVEGVQIQQRVVRRRHVDAAHDGGLGGDRGLAGRRAEPPL